MSNRKKPFTFTLEPTQEEFLERMKRDVGCSHAFIIRKAVKEFIEREALKERREIENFMGVTDEMREESKRFNQVVRERLVKKKARGEKLSSAHIEFLQTLPVA